MSKQITDTLLMIRPVAFRMNEQTAVNNYYQKRIDGLTADEIQQRAPQEDAARQILDVQEDRSARGREARHRLEEAGREAERG